MSDLVATATATVRFLRQWHLSIGRPLATDVAVAAAANLDKALEQIEGARLLSPAALAAADADADAKGVAVGIMLQGS